MGILTLKSMVAYIPRMWEECIGQSCFTGSAISVIFACYSSQPASKPAVFSFVTKSLIDKLRSFREQFHIHCIYPF